MTKFFASKFAVLPTRQKAKQMASEIQNSNPTILNAADLPTRLHPTAPRKSGAYGAGIFTSALPSNPNDPFSSPYSSEISDSESELMEEPIDEQEIYGNPSHLLFSLVYMWKSLLIIAFRPHIYHLWPGTPYFTGCASCRFSSWYLYQALASTRVGVAPSDSLGADHADNHPLQFSDGDRLGCARSIGAIASSSVPCGCAN